MPLTAKIERKHVEQDFLLLGIKGLPSIEPAGMFLVISCFCVMNVVADISTISTAVTICTCRLSAPMNFSEMFAPKTDASAACGEVVGQETLPLGGSLPMPFSTWKRAKKMGACARIGRQLDSGFVPVSL